MPRAAGSRFGFAIINKTKTGIPWRGHLFLVRLTGFPACDAELVL